MIFRIALVAFTLYNAGAFSAPTNKNLEEPKGTWENKDEDGDGVLDENDDYPFDARKSQYPVYLEQEPNDNPGIATPIKLVQGVRVKGAISSNLDKGDLYQFEVAERKSLTAVFYTNSKDFKPQVYVSNETGSVIDEIFLYKYQKPNIYVVNFPIFTAGKYQLSVIDENYAGTPNFTYEILFFSDRDVDGLDDLKETAFGANTQSNDQDKDKILDGMEFNQFNSDLDSDGIPNWLDTDSDNDTFSDRTEGSNDLDNDGMPNYLDKDADGNGIEDKLESGLSNKPNNFDNDRFIDHLDLDDDNDGVFDMYDKYRLEKLKVKPWQRTGGLSISSLDTLFDNRKVNYFTRANDEIELIVEGYPESIENPVVLIKTKKGQHYNVIASKVNKINDNTVMRFVMPNASGDANVSIVADRFKSEPYPLEIKSGQLPLLSALNPKVLIPGEVIVLNGDNFDNDTSVLFESMPVKATMISPSEITVRVPHNVAGTSYSVTNQHGQSNYVNYSIQQSITFNVIEKYAKPIDAIGGIYPTMAKPITGDTFLLTKTDEQSQVVFTYTKDNLGELHAYLSAIHFNGQTRVDFSFESTALACIALPMTHVYQSKGLNTKEFITIIQASNIYERYIDEVTEHIKQDSSFFSYKNRTQQTEDFIAKYEVMFEKALSRAPAKKS